MNRKEVRCEKRWAKWAAGITEEEAVATPAVLNQAECLEAQRATLPVADQAAFRQEHREICLAAHRTDRLAHNRFGAERPTFLRKR